MSFFDIQVNGYGGVDFNQGHLSAEDLHTACQALKRDGTDGILATIITEKLDKMQARIARLVELREKDDLAKSIIAGIHVEGPFISPEDGYRGAHPLDSVLPATPDGAQKLVDAGGGLVKLLTLAPEHDHNFATTKMLADQGIVVSAGHCNASIKQLNSSVDAGLSMVTHLGNGCPMNMNRHDNIVQRCLALADKLWLCFIADGAHIPFFALQNYLKLAGTKKTIVTSDAVAPAGLGPGNYTLARWEITIGEDLVARAPDGSHLVGSALSLTKAADNLRTQLNLDDSAIARLTDTNPRQALGA